MTEITEQDARLATKINTVTEKGARGTGPEVPMQVVKLSALGAMYRPFVTQLMLRAKIGCPRCYGRGYNGIALSKQNRQPIPCGCVVVNAVALTEAIDRAIAAGDNTKAVPLTFLSSKRTFT